MGTVSDPTKRLDQSGNRQSLSPRTRAGRWQAEFPYGWDADDLVHRRQLLRWSVGVAGALFGMTGLLAGLGFVRARTRGGPQEVIAADEMAVNDVHYFDYPDTGDHAILLRLEDERFVAYNGICTHLACEVYWDADVRELICPCHNGRFDPTTGEPIAGPPARPLPAIRLENDNGVIVALEEVTRDV